MRIVVDTNIIFSALLNSNSNIGDLIFNSEPYFEFYSCNYMRYEIRKYWERRKQISKLSDEQLQVSYTLVLSKLKFINEELIPATTWKASEELVKGIDINDIDFVALTTFIQASLWTGDKVLYKGLKKYRVQRIVEHSRIACSQNS